MLREDSVRTVEDEWSLVELKALNDGAIAVDSDLMEAVIAKKLRCDDK